MPNTEGAFFYSDILFLWEIGFVSLFLNESPCAREAYFLFVAPCDASAAVGIEEETVGALHEHCAGGVVVLCSRFGGLGDGYGTDDHVLVCRVGESKGIFVHFLAVPEFALRVLRRVVQV